MLEYFYFVVNVFKYNHLEDLEQAQQNLFSYLSSTLPTSLEDTGMWPSSRIKAIKDSVSLSIGLL